MKVFIVLVVILLIVAMILAVSIIIFALSKNVNRHIKVNGVIEEAPKPKSFYSKTKEEQKIKPRVVESNGEFSNIIRQVLQETDTINCITYTQYLEKCAASFIHLYEKKISVNDVAAIFKRYDDEIYDRYMALIMENCEEASALEKETEAFNREIGAGDDFPEHVEDLKIAHPDEETLEQPAWVWSKLSDDDCIEIVDEE